MEQRVETNNTSSSEASDNHSDSASSSSSGDVNKGDTMPSTTSATEKNESIRKILQDLVRDLLLTFPALLVMLIDRKEYFDTIDILYQNEEIETNLNSIDFTVLWKENISDKTEKK